MLPIAIKASSITNLTDARYFAAWGVQWIGFNLNPISEHFIDTSTVHAIKEWVEGPQIVIEWDGQDYHQIETIVQDVKPDLIQIGPFTTIDTLIQWQPELPIIKQIIVDGESSSSSLEVTIQKFSTHCAFFLLNFNANGYNLNNIPFTIEWLTQLCQKYPILISINESNKILDDLLHKIKPAGLSVHGGNEEKVGYKSFDELDDLFEALEERM
ncbi:MAG: hypothetical protein HRU40_04010 [Saprospiraceae bacterium]|nr:hypothetical protein [Saprospiraceae bacterium]